MACLLAITTPYADVCRAGDTNQIDFQLEIVPTDGHQRCQLKEQRFRNVAVFWAALQATARLYQALMDATEVNSNTANKRPTP